MPSSRKDWFPTPIWHFILDDYQHLNDTLLQEINAEQQRDRTGEKWSNILGWHSVSNLHQRESFAEFNSIIGANVIEVANCLTLGLAKILTRTQKLLGDRQW